MNDDEHPIYDAVVGVGILYLLYQGIKDIFSQPKQEEIAVNEIVNRNGDRYQNGAGIWFRK
jgi:hypothetical protein